MAAPHIGITLTKHFTSSTCCVLQSVHGSSAEPSDLNLSSGVMIAALFRKLKAIKRGYSLLPKDSNFESGDPPELISVRKLGIDGV